jgi:hypothetical protein
MDETLRFFLGIALFLAVIVYEKLKESSNKQTY